MKRTLAAPTCDNVLCVMDVSVSALAEVDRLVWMSAVPEVPVTSAEQT